MYSYFCQIRENDNSINLTSTIEVETKDTNQGHEREKIAGGSASNGCRTINDEIDMVEKSQVAIGFKLEVSNGSDEFRQKIQEFNYLSNTSKVPSKRNSWSTRENQNHIWGQSAQKSS